MLRQIQNFESQNLKYHLRQIALGSLETVNNALKDEGSRKDILNQAFRSALLGIRTGEMKYEEDPFLPLLQREMESRINHFKGLSAEEESKILSLTADQRRIIADQDKK